MMIGKLTWRVLADARRKKRAEAREGPGEIVGATIYKLNTADGCVGITTPRPRNTMKIRGCILHLPKTVGADSVTSERIEFDGRGLIPAARAAGVAPLSSWPANPLRAEGGSGAACVSIHAAVEKVGPDRRGTLAAVNDPDLTRGIDGGVVERRAILTRHKPRCV